MARPQKPAAAPPAPVSPAYSEIETLALGLGLMCGVVLNMIGEGRAIALAGKVGVTDAQILQLRQAAELQLKGKRS